MSQLEARPVLLVRDGKIPTSAIQAHGPDNGT
jgi:hypothetical protein